MDKPKCVKCGSSDTMALEDSGATYSTWRCTRCNVSRTQKNLLGKTLPFVPVALLAIFGLPDGGATDFLSGGS